MGGLSLDRWYYDACVLDKSKSAYAEMFNRHYPIKAVISHLALGEAFANSHRRGNEVADAFMSLVRDLSPYIEIVGNDGCDAILHDVKREFQHLSITDALHVATAIKNNCVNLRTIDRDLYGIPQRKKLQEIGVKFGLRSFSITKMVFRS